MRGLLLFLVLLASGSTLPGVGKARAAEVVSVTPADGWLVFGGKLDFARDAGAPGGGAAVVAPTETAQPWSSGAVASIGGAVRAGETYTAVFWIRAPGTARISALLMTNLPPYPSFASVEVVGADGWKRMTVTGVAKADAEPSRDALALHLGRAGGPVALGPAVVVRGRPATPSSRRSRRTTGPTAWPRT